MLHNTMTDNHLRLFCLVDGESTSFSVHVDPSETVDDLKVAIKDKNPETFNGVDAKDLTLWRVSIPVDDDDNDDIPIPLDSVPEKKRLKATTRLSKVFDTELPEDTIHIIVQRPPRGNASFFHLNYTLNVSLFIILILTPTLN